VNKCEVNAYLKRLFPICRSLTGEGNRETLEILREIVSIDVHEIPSDTTVYDWKIPQEWHIRDAWIKDSLGNKIVDFKENNLHVVSYSTGVDCKIDFEALEKRLYSHPYLKDAVPYRTSYYQPDWGFCVSQTQLERLKTAKQPLHVRIDAFHKHGHMTLGELRIPGEYKREFLFSCYICHPSMANDSLSGVLLSALLAKQLSEIKTRKWSYRFAFVPETIGAIAYMKLREDELHLIDTGLVLTTLGGGGDFGIKYSFEKGHWINRLISEVFKEARRSLLEYDFDIHGSDERQYSSDPFRINVAGLSKDKYYEYDYYHTSLDDLDFVRPEALLESLDMLGKIVDALEDLRFFKTTVGGGEVMLSKHGLYPKIGGAGNFSAQTKTPLDIRLWIIFYSDGKRPLQAIANIINCEFSDALREAKLMCEKGILVEV